MARRFKPSEEAAWFLRSIRAAIEDVILPDGQSSDAERKALADLLDALVHCLEEGDPLKIEEWAARGAGVLFEEVDGRPFQRLRRLAREVQARLPDSLLEDPDGAVTAALTHLGRVSLRALSPERHQALRSRGPHDTGSLPPESESQARLLESLLDAMGEAVCVIDTGTYDIQTINRAFVEINGIAKPRLAVGSPCHEVLHGLPVPCGELGMPCPLDTVVKTGGPVLHGPSHAHYLPEGVRQMVEVSAAPLRDATGNLRAIVHVTRDVTERVEAEERLEAAREEERSRLQRLVTGLPIGVLLLDSDGGIQVATPLARGYLSALGEALEEVSAEEVPIAVANQALEHPESRGPLEVTVPAGRVFTVSAHRTPETRETLLVLVEITEQREQERRESVQERLTVLGQLAGGIAHDFNNLLSVILGGAAVLQQDTSRPPRQQMAAKHIRDAGQRAAKLTRQLLELGRQRLSQPGLIDLNATTQSMGTLLPTLLGEDIELELRLSPGPTRVSLDPSQAEQILSNLATNARDAMPQGGRIEIHTEVIELDEPTGSSGLAPGVHVRLSVKDTGEGMPEDVRRHLFEPFFTTKPPGEGTGLGLSTVYGIVKGAGGHIDIESEIGRGTRFDIFLPVAEDPGEVTENGESDSITRGHGEVVLVVEDEDAVRETLADTLQQSDYRVLCASTGAQALELLERYEGKVDLLVTDVVMPGMSGPALVERMSHQWPSVRVLYMSGYIEDKLSRYRRLARSKTPLLQKPVEPDELTRRVRQVLDGTDG